MVEIEFLLGAIAVILQLAIAVLVMGNLLLPVLALELELLELLQLRSLMVDFRLTLENLRFHLVQILGDRDGFL